MEAGQIRRCGDLAGRSTPAVRSRPGAAHEKILVGRRQARDVEVILLILIVAHGIDERGRDLRDLRAGDVGEGVERNEGLRVDQRRRGSQVFTLEVTVVVEMVFDERIERLRDDPFHPSVGPAHLELGPTA